METLALNVDCSPMMKVYGCPIYEAMTMSRDFKYSISVATGKLQCILEKRWRMGRKLVVLLMSVGFQPMYIMTQKLRKSSVGQLREVELVWKPSHYM